MSDVKLERYQSVSGPCYRIREAVSDREVCLTQDEVRELYAKLGDVLGMCGDTACESDYPYDGPCKRCGKECKPRAGSKPPRT